MGGTPPIIKTQAPAPTRGSFGKSDDYSPSEVKAEGIDIKPKAKKDLKIRPKSKTGAGAGVKY